MVFVNGGKMNQHGGQGGKGSSDIASYHPIPAAYYEVRPSYQDDRPAFPNQREDIVNSLIFSMWDQPAFPTNERPSEPVHPTRHRGDGDSQPANIGARSKPDDYMGIPRHNSDQANNQDLLQPQGRKYTIAALGLDDTSASRFDQADLVQQAYEDQNNQVQNPEFQCASSYSENHAEISCPPPMIPYPPRSLPQGVGTTVPHGIPRKSILLWLLGEPILHAVSDYGYPSNESTDCQTTAQTALPRESLGLSVEYYPLEAMSTPKVGAGDDTHTPATNDFSNTDCLTIGQKTHQSRKRSYQRDGDKSGEDGQRTRQRTRQWYDKKGAEEKEEGGEGECLLACPFFKKDPLNHPECSRATLRDMSRLKQHLKRKHSGQPSGNGQPINNIDIITEAQMEALSEKVPPLESPIKVYYRMWRILFPGTPSPNSPYRENVLEVGARSFYNFATKRENIYRLEYANGRFLQVFEGVHAEYQASIGSR